MAFINREYLATQFNNFATRVSLIFAKKDELLKPDGTTITKDPDGTIHAVSVEEGTTDYDALENKPSIGGTTLSGNKTLDDLGIQPKGNYLEDGALDDYALVSETGYQLGLSINTTDYVMTLELKDKSGNVLDTKTIDFPIESMVVSASYSAGQLTLTLQNGQTLDPIDISDIVGGLVSDTFTIAGIDMKDNITKEELQTALDVPKSVSDLPDSEDYLKADDVETSNIDFSTYFAD